MNGVLHLAPVLHLPNPDIDVKDISLKVETAHRIYAPHQPLVRKAQSFDEFAIAGLSDSVFGWTADLKHEASDRPLVFQLNWTLRAGDRHRQCQHRLTIKRSPASGMKVPLWSMDTSLWSEAATDSMWAGCRTPFSLFERSQLIDELQRDITMTVRARVTTIIEEISIPAMERDDVVNVMAERYAIAQKFAA